MNATIPRSRRSRHRPLVRAAWTRVASATLLLALVGNGAGADDGANGSEHYRTGLGLLARGLNEEAATELRMAIEAVPDPTPESRYALAVCLARLDRAQEARQVLSSIPDEAAFEFAADATFLRGRLAFEAGDHLDAAATLGRLSATHPTFPRLSEAERLRGEALLRAGRADEARTVLAAALERWPDDASRARTELLCGAAEASAGDDAAAAARLGRLRRSERDSAIASAAALLEAQSLHRLARWEACIDACQATGLAEASFASDVPAATLRRSALLRLGDEALGRGDVREAERCLSALVAAAPAEELPPALLRLAMAVERQGRRAEALPFYQRVATSSGAESPHARLAAADVLVALGQKAEATAALESMADESSPVPLAFRAAALDRLATQAVDAGRRDEAMARHGELLALEGADHALRQRAGLELARLHLEADEPSATIEALDAVAALAVEANEVTNDPATREREAYLRGAAFARLGRSAEAAAALVPFASSSRDDDLARSGRVLLGESRLAAGDATGAIEVLDALLDGATLDQLPPSVAAAALLRLGEACTTAQRWTAADEAFTRFLDRFPEHELWFQAAFGQGFAREQQGRHEAAIEAYRTVVDRHQGDTAARSRFQIGECLFALGRLDEAVREFVKVDVLHGSPEWSAAALYEAGRCLAAQGRTVDARRQFENVAARDGAGAWADMARARIAELAPAPLPGRS